MSRKIDPKSSRRDDFGFRVFYRFFALSMFLCVDDDHASRDVHEFVHHDDEAGCCR